MSYQVLARKWRPQMFANVVSLKHVLVALKNILSLGRIHHAYLFSGMRGIGKTSIARLLAKGLNCEIGVTATPCSACVSCREIELGRFVDLIEIDAASRTKVEDMIDLLDNIQYAPARGRFKVYLIDEIHMLSRHSLNALLKTLEEPPEHTKFLLATTDPQKLPATILSRCLQFHLKALDTELICSLLEHILYSENIEYEPYALLMLARAADGSLRDALNLTELAIASGNNKLSTENVIIMLGTLDDNLALSLIEAVIDADGQRTLSLVDEAATRGVVWENLLIRMLSLLHRLAMLQLSSSTISDDMAVIEQRLRNLACTVPPNEILFYYQTLLIGRKELPFAPDRRMGVEMTLLRALAFHPSTIMLPESHTSSYMSSDTILPTAVNTPVQTLLQLSQFTSKIEAPSSSELSDATDTASSSIAIRNLLRYAQREDKFKQSKKVVPVRALLTDKVESKISVSITESAHLSPILHTFEQKDLVKKTNFCLKTTAITEEVAAKLATFQKPKKRLNIK